MDFLEQNLKALSRHNPRVFSTLKKVLSDPSSAGSFQFLDFGDGFKNLEHQDSNGKKSVLYHLHPQKLTEKCFAISVWQNPRIIVVDGFGLGYHFIEFLKKKPESVRDILVVEKSPWRFVQALRLNDFTQCIASDECEFLLGLREEEFDLVLTDYLTRHERILYAGRVGHFYFEPSLNEDGPYYLSFAEALQKNVAEIREAFAPPPEDNFRALFNIVRNRERIESAPTLFSMKDSFKEVPAILVGAGPSLEPELENLKKYQDRVLILAVDAAVKPLLSRGIRPHCVLTTERVAVVQHLLSGLPADFDVPLFALPSSHPDVLSKYLGPIILLRREATFGSWLWPEAPQLHLPIGVTPAALVVLNYLGSPEVALLGQDLSWPAEHKSGYVSGTNEFAVKTAKDAKNADSETVLGNNGIQVTTTYGWKKALHELERFIPSLGIPVYHVIDEKQGAKIHAARRIAPKEFWKTLSGKPVLTDVSLLMKNSIAKSKKSFPEGELQNLFRKTVSYLEDFIPAMQNILEVMSLEYHDKIQSRDAASFLPEQPEVLARWRELQKQLISRDPALFYFFVNMTAGTSYVMDLSERESLILDPDRSIFYMFRYLLKTIDWGNGTVAWAGRMHHLLKKYV